MRKQTKLVAVLSAAALLAIGASMTSFAAAKGWTQEDGTWVYLDSSGDRVYDTWKKSGSGYFYLNEDGEMATNAIIEDGDDKYYVDASGARVTNQWISVDNEEDEEIGGNDDISTIWYYFGSNGKANRDTNGTNGVKTVNGKKYLFDDNGYMCSGWQNYGDEWYYFGDENEGWAYTGWQYLEVQEELEDNDDYDDEEWYYFKPSNGKAYKNDRKYISGKYYAFDEYGVMQDKWVLGTPTNIDISTDESARYKADNGAQESGWVYAYPINDPDEEGEDQYWYYLDSKGVPFNLNGSHTQILVDKNNQPIYDMAETEIRKKDNETWKKDTLTGVATKVIKSKTYLFNNKGEMQTGVFIFYAPVSRTGGAYLDGGVYYFNKDSGSGQGAMAKGKTSVVYDGDTYNYYFQKDGSAYRMYIADGILYDGFGERVDAEDGNTYEVIELSRIAAFDSDTVVNIKGDKNATLSLDERVIVNSSGKVKKAGTVKIDGIKYTVDNYRITKEENAD